MGYDMYTCKRGKYYRLNIWGMANVRATMSLLGMVVRVDHPTGQGLDGASFTEDERGTISSMVEGVLAGEKVKGPRKLLSAARAEAKLVKTNPVPNRGIAFYKLCSNSGWCVTPRECRSAIKTYEKHSEETVFRAIACVKAHDDPADAEVTREDLEWFEEWVAYLREAEKLNGFRVW